MAIMATTHIDNAAARVADRLLVDTVTVTRNSGGVHDDTMDPVTGVITAGAATTIYTGAALISDRAGRREKREHSEAITEIKNLARVRLPRTCPQLERDDTVTVTATDNVAIVGAAFSVVADQFHSLAVSRLVTCELIDRGA